MGALPVLRALPAGRAPIPAAFRVGPDVGRGVVAPQYFAAVRALSGPVTITALPAEVNVVMYQGDSFAMSLVVTDQNGAPVDLAGAMLSEIRVSSDDELLGTFATSTVANSVSLYLDPATSAALPLLAQWDVKWTAASGWITTLAGGSLTTQRRITQVP